jgi:hypothetical protein
MNTEYRTDMKDDGSDASARVRLDSAQPAPPSPHVFDLPDIREIQHLTRWLDGNEINISEFGERLDGNEINISEFGERLDGNEINISEFGERLAGHDGLSRYVIAVANYSAASAESAIREPTHAAAFLGQRALRRLLSPLAEKSASDA